MNDEMKRYEKMCAEKFSTHKATIITENDRYFILDWRRGDDSGDWYINFIVDKKRGAFMVSGDLGDSIAVWYNPTTPEKIRSYIKDIGYYTKKIQCASDLYNYDDDNIIADIKEHIDDDSVSDWLETNGDYDDVYEFWEEIGDMVSDCVYNHETVFVPSDELRNIMNDIIPDYWWEWLYDCGRRIDGRVYIWTIGFRMAMEQLGR